MVCLQDLKIPKSTNFSVFVAFPTDYPTNSNYYHKKNTAAEKKYPQKSTFSHDSILDSYKKLPKDPGYILNAQRFTLKAPIPGYTAALPSSSSIRRSWLYFATRSVRLGAPVLIWQVFSATARSAIVVSSVSPER